MNFCQRVGAVHLGCLVQVGRDALERPGRDDRVERPAEPCVRREQREVGQRQGDERDRIVDLAEPVDLEGVWRDLEQDADPLERHVDRPVVLVEQVPPDRRHDDRRDDHREDEQGPVDLLEAQPVDVEDEGDGDAEDDVDDHVGEGPEEVEEEQPQELEVRDVQLARDDLFVVVEADDVGRDLAAEVSQAEVRERHPGLEEQRIERDDPHHQERRQQIEHAVRVSGVRRLRRRGWGIGSGTAGAVIA